LAWLNPYFVEMSGENEFYLLICCPFKHLHCFLTHAGSDVFQILGSIRGFLARKKIPDHADIKKI